MPRFFIENQPTTNQATLSAEDGKHIVKSLRMKTGDAITLCDCMGTDYTGEISEILAETVTVTILHSDKNQTEPSIQVTLYQSLPKGEKLDSVMQKAVEMGVTSLVPILSSRCVSRPDAKSAIKKVSRWQKIVTQAAKQCGRGILPLVNPITPFQEAIKTATSTGQTLFFYEGGGARLPELITKNAKNISLFIGPEGGFSAEEVAFAVAAGAQKATLGPRILRTETAPIAALSAIMLLTDNL